MRSLKIFVAVSVLTVFFIALCGCSSRPKGEERTCSLTVRCDAVLALEDERAKEIEELYPDGVVFSSDTAVFYEGESLLELMTREMKDAKIAFVQEKSAPADAAYVKSIAGVSPDLFGDMSGWLYYVNGQMPSVGCSDYRLNQDDNVEWVFSVDVTKEFE